MSDPAVRSIVSLLPSATEIVCALGLRERLIGVTHECDYPPGLEALPRLTANRLPSVHQPTLVIGCEQDLVARFVITAR